MKIFHTICAAFMAATIASCDAHQDFPDTSMKIGDILCTDGKVVRYEEMKAQEKTPIAVVFYVNQSMILPQTWQPSMGIAIPMPCILPILRLQPSLFLTCGNTDRVPTSLPLPSYTFCMIQEIRLTNISVNVVEMRYRTILMNAGTGLLQK